MSLRFTNLVECLPAAVPFVGPETVERRMGRHFQARIGANESAFGMSPMAKAAIAQSCDIGAWYGDPECFELRQKLALMHGVDIDEICMGAGIDELLGLAVRLVCSPGTPIVTSNGAYPTLNYHIAGYGGERIAVPYTDDCEDLQALAAAVRQHKAALVYLANPDNPMGTWHNREAIVDFLNTLPEGVLVLLDEAYVEFAPTEAVPPIDTGDPRVVRLRTFSKAHGLAGLRIGYVIAHKRLTQALGKVRNHFAVNRLAQAAAMASLEDRAFIDEVKRQVAEGRQDYARMARGWGFEAIASATNFVAVDVGGADRAKRILQALETKGVFIRMPGVAPLNRCIRLSVGRVEERQLLDRAMREILAAGF